MIAHWQPSTSLRAQKEPYTSQVKPQHRSTNQSTTPCCVFPYIRASRVSSVSNSMPPWQDVIKVLLRKFRVADNPHKYALYERQDDYRGDRYELFFTKQKLKLFFSFPRSKSLSRLRLRRLQEDEKPLVLAVLWGRTGGGEGRKFVLQVGRDPEYNLQPIINVQENDPGEIEWEQFSLPELKNFLLILDREEAWYKRRIHEKYETVQEEILRLLHEKNREEAEKEYWSGQFERSKKSQYHNSLFCTEEGSSGIFQNWGIFRSLDSQTGIKLFWRAEPSDRNSWTWTSWSRNLEKENAFSWFRRLKFLHKLCHGQNV